MARWEPNDINWKSYQISIKITANIYFSISSHKSSFISYYLKKNHSINNIDLFSVIEIVGYKNKLD